VAGAANSAAEVLTQSVRSLFIGCLSVFHSMGYQATYVNIHVTAECPHISLPRRQNSASHFMLDLGTLNISNKFIKDAEDNGSQLLALFLVVLTLMEQKSTKLSSL
jgi:hypothetical protein